MRKCDSGKDFFLFGAIRYVSRRSATAAIYLMPALAAQPLSGPRALLSAQSRADDIP
jgi:hypothetical protein